MNKIPIIILAFLAVIVISSMAWGFIINPAYDFPLKLVIGIFALAFDAVALIVAIRDP